MEEYYKASDSYNYDEEDDDFSRVSETSFLSEGNIAIPYPSK
jgi:hypothetical protein